MAWVRQYSAPNIVGARKVKAFINSLLYEKRPLLFSPSSGGLGATYAVNLRLTGKPVVDLLLMIIELLSLGVVSLGSRRF